MAFKVSKTCTNCFYIFFCQCILSYASIHLKSTKGCNNDYCIWRSWQVWSLNVQEFLGSKICPKSCFSHRIISQVQRCASRQNRVTAVSDIGKWSTMNKGWCPVNSLYQIWLNRIFQDQSQGTFDFKITNIDW